MFLDYTYINIQCLPLHPNSDVINKDFYLILPLVFLLQKIKVKFFCSFYKRNFEQILNELDV
jgi:hypothetical protein